MTAEFNLSEKITLMKEYKTYPCPCDEHTGISVKDIKEFIRLLKEEFIICRDKTDIWADEERWNKFEKMFKNKLKELAGDKLI